MISQFEKDAFYQSFDCFLPSSTSSSILISSSFLIDYKFIPTIQSLNKETLNLKISNSLEQKKQQTISNLISTSSTSTSYLSYGTIGLGTPKLNRVKSLNSLKPIKSNDDKKGEEEQADNELGVEGTKGKGKTIETVGGLLVPGNNRIPQLLRRCSSADSLAAREEAEFNSDESPFRIRPRSASATSSINSQRSPFAIRLDDNSNRQTSTFTKEVKIVGYYPVVGEKKSLGYVVFDIHVITNENTTLRILKRYTQFVTLHKTLSDNYPKLKQFIPPLPPKSSLAKYRPAFLEKRRQLLTYWLNAILLHPEYGGSDCLKSFVTRDD